MDFIMRGTFAVSLVLISCSLTAVAQQPPVAPRTTATAPSQPASPTAHFDAVLRQALAALSQAGGYSVQVDSTWGANSQEHAAHGGSRYMLFSQGGKYRVEVQSTGAQSPDLICVNDGTHVTTLYLARKLYAQHPADSLQASLSGNKMLALS